MEIRQLKREKEEEVSKLKLEMENEILDRKAEKEAQEKLCQQEKSDLQSEHDVEVNKLAGELSNKNILFNYLLTVLQDNEKRSQAQNYKIKVLGEERNTYQERDKVSLRHAYLQAEVILSQERQKYDLEDALRTERNLREGYCNLTELNSANTVENYPAYVQMMTKALTDQTEDLEKLRSFLDDENKLEAYLQEIMENMEKLNITLTSNSAEWDLHGSLMSLVEVQAESLESLKPTLSYFVNNNRDLTYQEIDGNLVAVSTCQCVPQTEDVNTTVSGIEFTSPEGMAVPDTGERTEVPQFVCTSAMERILAAQGAFRCIVEGETLSADLED